MAETTTIRIDREVHRRLVVLSQQTGRQLIDVVRDATEALERAQFAASVANDLERLRQDPQAWADYVGDADLALRDGLT
jgi:predicted DNA-binding protein